MKTVFSFPNKEILLILEDELLKLTLSVYRVLPWCLLHIVISVNVPLGQQRNRKMSENNISVCKTLFLSLTLSGETENSFRLLPSPEVGGLLFP